MILGDLLVFAICIVVAYVPSIVGAFTTSVSVKQPWYDELKPSYTPPSVVFPIVWSILYFCIGVALFLAVRFTPDNLGLVSLFAINLVLNGIWSPLFFNQRAFEVALAVLCILLVSIVSILWGFAVWSTGWVRVTGIVLIVPYLAWCSFAAALNAGFIKNKNKHLQSESASS